MVEAFRKTCNVKHEIDIKHYGNAKSETDSCQSFCFGLSFRILSYSSLKHRLILLDGQVTALVKQRQSIRHFLCRRKELSSASYFS